MNKTIATLTGLLIAHSAFALPMTDGVYKGEAYWKSANKHGTYKVETALLKNQVKAQYLLPDGSIKNWVFEAQETSSGFFNVISNGVKLGSGYCLENAHVCHYEISAPQLKLEETLVQDGNKMYRFGSKNQGDGTIVWQEMLTQE